MSTPLVDNFNASSAGAPTSTTRIPRSAGAQYSTPAPLAPFPVPTADSRPVPESAGAPTTRSYHIVAAECILRYLRGTPDLLICYTRSSGSTVPHVLSGYVDADHAGDPNARLSVTGYLYPKLLISYIRFCLRISSNDIFSAFLSWKHSFFACPYTSSQRSLQNLRSPTRLLPSFPRTICPQLLLHRGRPSRHISKVPRATLNAVHWMPFLRFDIYRALRQDQYH
jgi:hypothetical protein